MIQIMDAPTFVEILPMQQGTSIMMKPNVSVKQIISEMILVKHVTIIVQATALVQPIMNGIQRNFNAK